MDYGRVGRVYGPKDFPQPKVRPSTAASSASFDIASRNRVERARRYVAVLPPAIQGSHGDVYTFRVCCRLVRGFALEDGEALAVLQDWNNRCQPPWTERELAQKVSRARRYGREPVGGLLVARAQNS
jgi:hypothetical protein